MGAARVLALLAITACYERPEPSPYTQRTWAQRGPLTTPSARAGGRLVYDPLSQRMLLYGGKNQSTVVVGEMWSWDGFDWTLICQDCPPGTRRGHGLVYDSVRQRVVLFGGETATALGTNDTWEWDGQTWQAMSPGGTVPVARTQAYMIFDPVRGRTVLYGGTTLAATDDSNTYEYDGATWTALAPVQHPPMGHDFGSSATFDVLTGEAFLFGGVPETDELWGWDGIIWTRRCQDCSGLARGGAGLVHDPTRDRFVVVGGYAGGNEVAGTWESMESVEDGFQVASDGTPTARDSAAIAYDPHRDVIVLFGGNGDGCVAQDCGETYEFVPVTQ